jgi:hypothetical protein
MNKLLAAVLLLLPILTVEAQPSIWWGANNISTNVNGGTIVKNDTIVMEVKLNPNFSSIRSVFFDFQHQKDAIELLDVQRGAGIPEAASFSYTNNYYPNCKFNRTQNNTTNNGYDNYINANYTCNSSTVPYHAINRIMVNVSSAANLEHATYIKLRFKITNTDAGFPYDSVYMNFAFGYDVNGTTMTNTENVGAKGVWIQFDAAANNLIAGILGHSANTTSAIKDAMRLSVTDTATQPTEVTNRAVSGNGAFTFAQQLSTNNSYRVRLTLPAVDLAPLSLAATTISDYTMAVQEFITQNLDRTYKNNNINKGAKYWAADVNNNGEFDGGDLQVLFNAVTGLDTIMVPPQGCAQNCNVTLPVMRADEYDNLPLTNWNSVIAGKIITITPGEVEWIVLTPNAYSSGQSRILVDVRQIPAGVTAQSITSMNILDVYNGRVTFMGADASWATYKVPSNFVKATNGSSAYNTNIRNINNSNTDYGVSSTVTISNKDLYSVLARTTTSEQSLDLRYILKGDVNLSHSSLVADQQGASIVMGNLIVPGAGSIDTKLNNIVVTGDTITIPFNIDTKGIALSGLQYEVKYDPTLVKFDRMFIDTPSWVSFVHPMVGGTIRFGALDKDLKNPLTGTNLTPFRLRFVALRAGVDLNTSVVLTGVMDAADNKGNQVGINLSSTVIRLVGISNFR